MTSEHARPNPDELLAQVSAEENAQVHGKLKIFLGYVAGVGKTYAMLEAAHQRVTEGIDVAVACVETHGRAETEQILRGLPVIARKQVEYRGVTLPEMDVDAVLARRPQLALVDELAHTNAPGSRHPKRYQDVEELLDAGIDVYATLNVQHLESLNDVVAQITSVTVRETVPDRVIDEASAIELIDLPPDELLQRLNEGKVYVPERAAQAIQKFFRKGNLTALRELTMRRAAERVDEQMRAYMLTRAIPGPWPAADHLMVVINPASPDEERLVRAARRLADQLSADWSVVRVESPQEHRLSGVQGERLSHTLLLAEELGARLIVLPGQSVADTAIEYARGHNITKIVVGQSVRSRWEELLHRTLADELIHESGNIDVHVVSVAGEPMRDAVVRTWWPSSPARRYAEGVGLVGLATLLSTLVNRFIDPTNLVMIYLLGVVIASLFIGRGPSILVSILSVLAFDFFFVPPMLTFAVTDTQYILTFAGLLVVSLVVSQLATRVRDQVDMARQREAETATLYALSRDLATGVGLDGVTRAVISHVSQTFGREVALLLPGGEQDTALNPTPDSAAFIADENEHAVAVWTFRHGQLAGRGTDTLPAAGARYMPLKTARGVIGVMAVRPAGPVRELAPDQRRLLEAFASLAALAIERTQFAAAARHTELLEATEKLQSALLNSISHDLRTPLVSITGALTSLREDGVDLNDEAKRSLTETACDEAERLNRLVGNLLDMTRAEAGALRVHAEPADVQDVVGAALEQLNGRLGIRPIHVDVPAELPHIPMDFELMVRVLVNIIENALKYSPGGSPIDIMARRDGAEVEIGVADRGVGIPENDLERVFDKFYRVQRPGSVSGTGLGLSICKGIVEAHHGRIQADARPGGGTLMRIHLPLTSAGAGGAVP